MKVTRREELRLDYSTMDVERLHTCYPLYKKPATYRIDEHMGSGCWLDAPGYPSYFVQNVWTSSGNHPGRGATMVMYCQKCHEYHVISDHTTPFADGTMHKIYKRLWKPLPESHVRVQLWEEAVYRHMHCCYHTPWSKGGSHQVVFPSRPQFTEMHLDASRAMAAGLIRPDNHSAVVYIRKFYPEHQPNLALIARVPERVQNDWWEVSAKEVQV